MTAEMSARRTAATAVLVDYQRADDTYLDGRGTLPRPDFARWASRLAAELRSVLGQLEAEDRCPRIDGSLPATGPMPDGTAQLTRTDLLTVIGALSDAAWWQSKHAPDSGKAETYRALSYRLGDDR